MKKLLTFFAISVVTLLLLTSCKLPFGVGQPEHEHAFGEWTVTQEPDCTTEGLKVRKCSCNEEESEPIAALGHKNIFYASADPTCDEDGYDEYKCSKCDAITKKTTEKKLGHLFINGYTYNYDATATKDGTVTGYCSVCRDTASEAAVGSSEVIARAFAGKKVSIIGDSISTFHGVTNGNAADTSNTEIRSNSMFYSQAKADYLNMTVNDTWWMQSINALGAKLLVNNSNSGGYVSKYKDNGQPPAYLTPCVNLHDNTGDNAGETPDIILVYLGTNDYGACYNKYGSADSINIDDLAGKCGADYTAKNYIEAYAIMLYKITTAYPDAEIYCLNVLESILWGSKEPYLAGFNDEMFKLAEMFGAHTVDIFRDSGIKNDETFDDYIPADDGRATGKNTLHPNAKGMTLIANCVISAFSESKYYPSEDEILAEYKK